jgi:hypothetical protein
MKVHYNEKSYKYEELVPWWVLTVGNLLSGLSAVLYNKGWMVICQWSEGVAKYMLQWMCKLISGRVWLTSTEGGFLSLFSVAVCVNQDMVVFLSSDFNRFFFVLKCECYIFIVLMCCSFLYIAVLPLCFCITIYMSCVQNMCGKTGCMFLCLEAFSYNYLF